MQINTRKISPSPVTPFEEKSQNFHLHTINYQTPITLTYFDMTWELQECELMEIMTSPTLLCRFRKADIHKLVCLHQITFL